MSSSPQPPERNDPPSRTSDAQDADTSPSTSTNTGPEADYVDGVPTFDFVRDRIEGRYATALGSTELAEGSAQGRSLAQQQEDRDAAARERLEQIRKSLGGE